MALEPLSIRDMEERTGDQYEAVVVMSKRAKQVLRDRIMEELIDSTEEVEMGVYDQVIEKNPEDYVVGTGIAHSVEDFANKAFSHVGLNYKDHVIKDKNLIRPSEVDALLADYSKAKINLKWKPKISFESLVVNMVEKDLEIVTNTKY